MSSSSARGNYSHPSLEDDDLIDPDDGMQSPSRSDNLQDQQVANGTSRLE